MSNKIDFVYNDFCDLACHTGVTFIVDLQSISDCTNEANDLSGYTASLLIYNEYESVVIDTITGSILEPQKGIIHFEISASITQNYVVGVYKHHIEITSGTIVYRIAQGNFEVTE